MEAIRVEVFSREFGLSEEVIRFRKCVLVHDSEAQNVAIHESCNLASKIPCWVQLIADDLRLQLHAFLTKDLYDNVWVRFASQNAV